jgi:hypothetical protein
MMTVLAFILVSFPIFLLNKILRMLSSIPA